MLWLEAYHRRDVVFQHMRSAIDTKTPLFGMFFAQSGSQPHEDLIVSMLVYDPLLLFLGVPGLFLQGYQARGYGQRSCSEDESA
jgi:hypothetical protein